MSNDLPYTSTSYGNSTVKFPKKPCERKNVLSMLLFGLPGGTPTQLVLELPIDQSLTLTRKQNNGKNSENCRTE